jgi:uncharacterized protein YlxW (UPF0749 family)
MPIIEHHGAMEEGQIKQLHREAERPIDQDPLYIQLQERCDQFQTRAIRAEKDNGRLKQLVTDMETQLERYSQIILSKVLMVTTIQGDGVCIGVEPIKSSPPKRKGNGR